MSCTSVLGQYARPPPCIALPRNFECRNRLAARTGRTPAQPRRCTPNGSVLGLPCRARCNQKSYLCAHPGLTSGAAGPCWPRLASPEASRVMHANKSPPRPGWAADGDHLPANRGVSVLSGTCFRSTSLYGPSPLRTNRQVHGRVNSAWPAREPGFFLHVRLHFFWHRAYQALRGLRPRGTSVPCFLPPSQSTFKTGPLCHS